MEPSTSLENQLTNLDGNVTPGLSEKLETLCMKCNIIFKDSIETTRECNLCHAVLFIRCVSCGTRFRKQSTASKHAQKSCGQTTVKKTNDVQDVQQKIETFCARCGAMFKDNVENLKECNKCYAVLFIRCTDCDTRFRKRSSAIQHVQTCGIKKSTNECSRCGKIFDTPNSRAYHMSVCGKPFLKCKFCHYQSQREFNMERHLKDVHQES